MQNGSVACEYLGASSGRNVTPLDTDLSMIIQPEKTLMGTIGQTAATSFGPIWLVLKMMIDLILQELKMKQNMKKKSFQNRSLLHRCNG